MSQALYHAALAHAIQTRAPEDVARAEDLFRSGAPTESWERPCLCGARFDPVADAKWRGDSHHWRHALAGRWSTCDPCGRRYAWVGSPALGRAPMLLVPDGDDFRALRRAGGHPVIECTYAERVALDALETQRCVYDRAIKDRVEAHLACEHARRNGVPEEALVALRARSMHGLELMEFGRNLRAGVRRNQRALLARIVGARLMPSGRRAFVPAFGDLEWWRGRERRLYVAVGRLPRSSCGAYVDLSGGYTPLRYDPVDDVGAVELAQEDEEEDAGVVRLREIARSL